MLELSFATQILQDFSLACQREQSIIELALLKRDGARRIYCSLFEGGKHETAINSCVSSGRFVRIYASGKDDTRALS